MKTIAEAEAEQKKREALAASARDKYYRIALTVTGGGIALLVTLAHGTTMTCAGKILFALSIACFALSMICYLIEARQSSLALSGEEWSILLSRKGIWEWIERSALIALLLGVATALSFAAVTIGGAQYDAEHIQQNMELRDKTDGSETTAAAAENRQETQQIATPTPPSPAPAVPGSPTRKSE